VRVCFYAFEASKELKINGIDLTIIYWVPTGPVPLQNGVCMLTACVRAGVCGVSVLTMRFGVLRSGHMAWDVYPPYRTKYARSAWCQL
jgi:hypothetical protein